MMPPETKAIIGVARSGMTPAAIAAKMLHVPLLSLSQGKSDVVECGNGFRLAQGQHKPAPLDGLVVIVDDTVMTGHSMQTSIDIAEDIFPDFITAACFVYPETKCKPDLFVEELPAPHLLEWNVFNSAFLRCMALDFDGILCENPEVWQDDDGDSYLEFIKNAKPKYLPRRESIPLVVTARVEKYRHATLQWLEKHNVKVDRLVMHPAISTAEREQDCIASFKARHFKKWHEIAGGGIMDRIFLESEHWQAKEIADSSGLAVVCPASGAIFNRKFD
jgi:hypoxanthine phosphoribosyltransferase